MSVATFIEFGRLLPAHQKMLSCALRISSVLCAPSSNVRDQRNLPPVPHNLRNPDDPESCARVATVSLSFPPVDAVASRAPVTHRIRGKLVDVWFPSLPNGTRTRRACPPRRAGGHDQPSRSWLHSPCPTSRRLSGAGGRRKGVFARETSRCRFEDTTHDLTVAGLNVHAFAPWPLCERGASRRHPAHYPAADDRRSRLQGKLS